MSDTVHSQSQNAFKNNQIICLEHQQDCLYGEVIQIIDERQLCWFRPMCIVNSEDRLHFQEATNLIDLQSGLDLLWPIALFRPALDTEVISLLSKLGDTNDLSPQKSSRKYLNSFVKSVWQANKDKF